MKKYLAAFATVITLSAPVFAQTEPPLDPAVVDAIKQMLASTKMRDQMAEWLKQTQETLPQLMRASLTQTIMADKKMDAAQKQKQLARMEQILPEEVRKAQALLSDPGLADDMIAVAVPMYARTYTVEDIRQLNVFYQSPVGRKMLATLQPLMSQSVMEIRNRLLLPRVQKVMDEAAQALVGK
jgi:hypothetical protein